MNSLKKIILSAALLVTTVSCGDYESFHDALAAIEGGESWIYLYDDQIGDVGAIALAETLKNSQLTELNLGRNQIGDKGARALAEALKNSQLTDLRLSYNRIGDDGAKALADALEDSQLTQLNLDHNQIGDDGAKALAAALKDSQLIELTLGNNQIGDEGIWALKNVLKDSQLLDLGLGPTYNQILLNSLNSIVGRSKSPNRIEENSIEQLNDALSALHKKHLTFGKLI